MDDIDAESKQRNLRGWIAHGLNTAITICLAALAVNNDIIGGRNHHLEIAYERIAQLESDNAALRGADLEQATMLAKLQYTIDADFSPLVYLETYMDSVGLPMWIKVYNPLTEDFTVLMTNEAYTAYYGIPGSDYEGANDGSVWPERIAKEFQRNDMVVLGSKRREMFIETVQIQGKTVKRRIWKYYLVLPDGREAVAGIDVDAALIGG